jgi:phospholipase D1/2
MWSAGTTETERSIYRGYVSAIKNAQHFVYIENQYFISAIDRDTPKNRLLKAIYQR